MNILAALSITASTLAFNAPPILPFTELSDKKIEVALEHMLNANECTATDMNVLMQLDHIHWKYAQMRQVFYKTAQEATDGSVISTKDLGKMFDKIDASLEADREKDLERIQLERTRERRCALCVWRVGRVNRAALQRVSKHGKAARVVCHGDIEKHVTVSDACLCE